MTDLSFSLMPGGKALPRGNRAHPESRNEAPADALVLDPRRLNELRATLGEKRFGGLLDMLVADCVARPRRLRECLARDDEVAMRAEAQNLARAALSVGASALALTARALASLPEDIAPGTQLALVDHAAEATLRSARHLLAAAATGAVAH